MSTSAPGIAAALSIVTALAIVTAAVPSAAIAAAPVSAPASSSGSAPGSAPAHHGFALGVSAPAIALAALGALLALACIAWGISRMLAYEPSWAPALRHSFAEAGFRASATWAELLDFMRLGR